MTSIPKIPEEVRYIVNLLNYVGNVGHRQKLYFRDRVYVSEIDFQNRIIRYYYRENLESNLKTIRQIFRSYILLKIHYEHLYDRNLDDAFRNFYEGLCKLKNTYNNKNLNKFHMYIDTYLNMLL
jgi:hypothetical protein